MKVIEAHHKEGDTHLGKMGYYRQFIKGYAVITKPLNQVLCQSSGMNDNAKFMPTTVFRQAFEKLKKCLLQAPILAFPQFDSPEKFILDTDYSEKNRAIGGCIRKKQDGKERAITYGGKGLAANCDSYGSHKGELCAVIYFIRYWKYFLAYRKFLL